MQLSNAFRKYFLIILLGLTGFIGLGVSLLDALFLDYMTSSLIGKRYGDIEIDCGEIKGGLLGGFNLSNLKIKGLEGKEVLSIDSLFIKVRPLELFERDLVIDQARLTQIRAPVKNLNEFFRRLVGFMDSQAGHEGIQGGFFRNITCKQMHFVDLELINPLDLFLSDQKNFLEEIGLKLRNETRLQGSIMRKKNQIQIMATARDKGAEYGERLLPLKMELHYDSEMMKGEISFQAKGAPLRRLFGVRDLQTEGSVTLESQLHFSTHASEAGEKPAVIDLFKGVRMYYSLHGEGRLFARSIHYRNAQINDLYIKGSWTHRGFSIQHSEAHFLGSRIQGIYQYEKNNPHQYQLRFTKVDLHELLELLGIPALADELKGRFSFEVRGDPQGLSFSPVKVHSLEFLESPIFLHDVKIEALPPDFINSELKLQFSSDGGSYYGGFVDQIQGTITPKGILFQMKADGVPIQKISLFKKARQDIPVQGRLTMEVNGEISFEAREYKIQAKGNLFELEIGSLPVESLDFTYFKNATKNRLDGNLNLPIHDGVFAFSMDLLKKNGVLILKGDRFNFSYFKHRFENFPLEGTLSGTLKLQLYPVFQLDFIGQSSAIEVVGLGLKSVTTRIHLKQRRYQIKVVDRSGRLVVHGSYVLRDPFTGSFKPGESLIKKLGPMTFSFEEDKVERLRNFSFLKSLKFMSGKLAVNGSWDQGELHGEVRKAVLDGIDTRIWLKEPSPFHLDQKLHLDTKFKLYQAQIANSTGKELLRLDLNKGKLDLKVTDLELAVLHEFIPQHYNLPLQGQVSLNLKGNHLFDFPELSLEFSGAPISLDVQKGKTYLQKVSGRASVNQNRLKIDEVRLQKAGSEFLIQGILPYGIHAPELKLRKNPTGVLDLRIQLPKTPLEVVREIFPKQVLDARGDFELDMTVSGSLKTPVAKGEASVDLSLIRFQGGGKLHEFKDLNLKAHFMDKEISLSRISGHYNEANFNLSGSIFPYEDFRYYLKGQLKKPRFTNAYLDLSGVSLENFYLAGSGMRLSGMANLKVDRGLILYEPLMNFIEAPPGPPLIPFVEYYDFGLKVEQEKNVELRSDFFQMEIEPHFTLTLKAKNSEMEGHARVKQGNLEIARNRFRIEPGSLIKFIPGNQEIRLRGGAGLNLPQSGVWDSNQFQSGSVEDKLSLLWKSGSKSRRGQVKGAWTWQEKNNVFDTILSLRAETQIGKRRILLGLHGSLDNLGYNLDSDDESLGREDIVRLLASSGVQSPSARQVTQEGPNIEGETQKLPGDQDRRLLSRQLEARLEDQLLGRPFKGLLHDLFRLDEVSLEPNLLRKGGALRKFRMGTWLADDIFLSHERENLDYGMRKKTRLELQLKENLGLILKREHRVDHDFDLGKTEDRRDFQFGFERRLRF
jgi:hypothetical protein